MVGGRSLAVDSKHGCMFWKYLLRDYSVQLMEPDVVPECLRNADTCGLVTENHVSNRSNGIWDNRTCGNCERKHGTKHHGHSSGQKKCPLESGSNVDFLDRKKRKAEEIEAVGGIETIIIN